jgi:hypothetical protein
VPEKRNVLINSATAAIGGGMLVAIDIIKAVCSNENYSVTLICPPVSVYQKLEVEARKIYVPAKILKFYSRWYLDYFWLRKKIRDISPDLVITLGNLPAICQGRQIMFNDNAFVSEKSFTGFGLSEREFLAHSARKYFFIKRLKWLNTLVVQTSYEKFKFESLNKRLPEIKILPPLFPSHLLVETATKIQLPGRNARSIRLGCISFVHGHKNISRLVDVLEMAEKKSFPLQIIFTLSPAKSRLCICLLRRLKHFIENGTAINLGKIRSTQIKGLVAQLDGLILPSLNESYSLNYIEALAGNRQLFVSDRHFAREISKGHAWYFDPDNPEDILTKIVEVFQNESAEQISNDMPISDKIPIGTTAELFNLINRKLS